MAKWEYQLIDLTHGEATGFLTAWVMLTDELDKAGDDEWEVVGPVTIGQLTGDKTETKLLLKRTQLPD